MKVYKVEFASNEYQSFVAEDEGVYSTGLLSMKCKPKLDDWKPPRVRVFNPTRKKADLMSFCPGAYVARVFDIQDS